MCIRDSGNTAGDRTAERPDSVSAPPTAALTCVLPNGSTISCYNRAEISQFYEDIFIDHGYLRHGITLRDGDTIFDVGANVGLFTLYASLHCRAARILAFEPVPLLFDRLRENVACNGIHAALFCRALSDRRGSAKITFYPQSSGLSSLYADVREERQILDVVIGNRRAHSDGRVDALLAHADDYFAERLRSVAVDCELDTVSSVLAAERIPVIDLLKIDVQKSELDVLRGVASRDWPRIRQIAAEVHDVDGRARDIAALLTGHGYRVATMQEPLYAGSPIFKVFAVRDHG
jgi:phthiocerol/phenolphthiocerol synthesis type-I polyketide synthase E